MRPVESLDCCYHDNVTQEEKKKSQMSPMSPHFISKLTQKKRHRKIDSLIETLKKGDNERCPKRDIDIEREEETK